MSDEILLPTGNLGYAFEKENRPFLEAHGQDPSVMLSKYRDSFPEFNIKANPLGVFDIFNQNPLGSCQGASLGGVFEVCFFLATGRKIKFSKAAAYYLSQRKDGIRGDNGSTLSGGNWVATQHGLCLEEDWPYTRRYDPTEPRGIQYNYRLKVSRPFRQVQEVLDWVDSGLPVQIGLMWNDSCSREVVNNWRPGGGGHSTFYWLRAQSGNVNNINSWGERWNGDGMHEWTEASIDRALKHQWTVMIGYAPDEMTYPQQDPIV